VVSGNLDIASGTLLSFTDITSGTVQPFVEDTTIFAMINYTGRPYSQANHTIRFTRRGSSSGTRRVRRCVFRDCLITRHARRSLTRLRPSTIRTCSTAFRRFAGLRS